MTTTSHRYQSDFARRHFSEGIGTERLLSCKEPYR
jgi:hypothetical protein